MLVSGAASAAGLGKMSVQSALGQPLRAEIELLSVQPDDIGSVEAKLASPDAFRQARMDRAPVISDLQLSIEKRPNGKPVVKISSSVPVSDPFVDLLIELNWSSGRILREYTVLLDPVREQKAADEVAKSVPVPAVTTSATAGQRPAASAPVAQAPAAPAKPAAAKPAKPVTYGPVKSGETLRSIAKKVMLPDVTLEMMVASLYQVNKNSFARNNVNMLKQGEVLTVPDRDSVMLMFSPNQARQLLREHAEVWHEIRNRVANEAARSVAEAAPEDAGKGKIVQAQPEEKPAAKGAPKDVLKLSKGEPPRAADGKVGERVQALEEEIAAKSHALQEAQDRVSQLERTVQDLQRLLDLKAKDAGAKPGAEPPPAGQPVAEAPAAPPAQPAAPKPKAKAKPPIEVPVREPGFFQSLLATPLYIGGIVAAALLAILLWVFMVSSRRRKGLSDFEQSVMTGGDPFKTSIFKTGESTGSERGTTTQSGVGTDFSRLGLGSIDTHEVDPIAEAEVYMAYGRDAQAEEILKEALAKDPHRHEIALKLLEIYAGRQDRLSFETQASELYAGLGDPSSPIWAKATELGRQIDPANPLYRVFSEAPSLPDESPSGLPEAPDFAAPAAAPEPEPLALDTLEFDQPETPAAAEPEDDQPIQLDDLNFSVETADTSESLPAFGSPTEVELASEPEADLGALPGPDLDEALELPEELGLADLAGSEPEAAADETVMMPPADKLPDLDFSGIDLELAEPDAPPAAPVAEAEPAIEAPEEIDADILEEVNTKLDLARAYLEMGDKEGAREILDEVVKEGGAQQRAEAERLIASL
ncbi:FimV family protein [Parasulfuritortus cantonensis]|nr:FimV family protein [Parasulfuritortus cantonensis]